MRLIFSIFVSLVAGCGTKRNPQACCTSEADCLNVGLPVGTLCDEGLLCRGNRCVEQACSGTADCDVTAPYCVTTDEGRCSEACTADSQCPGLAQSDADQFCVAGGCVQCRESSDCDAAAPLCADGRCVTCAAHADCASGVCAGGTCAAEDEIAYVSTTGSPASECTPSSPCNSVIRAIAVSPPRRYVLIDSGTYSSTSAIILSGARTLIGRGAGRPVLTRSTDGAIIEDGVGADLKLEHIEIFGARGMSPNDGNGILCRSGSTKFELADMTVRMNASSGFAGSCSLVASSSHFDDNGYDGVQLIASTATIERCTANGNGGAGLFLDAGTFTVSNTVVARNARMGVELYATGPGNVFEFNTVIDNGRAAQNPSGGFDCNLQGAGSGTIANNIIARNLPFQTTGCVVANSLIIDDDIAPLKFKSPDAAPYDYHIQPGSTAVDFGGTSTIKIDMDGEARPAGAANDIGADELQ